MQSSADIFSVKILILLRTIEGFSKKIITQIKILVNDTLSFTPFLVYPNVIRKTKLKMLLAPQAIFKIIFSSYNPYRAVAKRSLIESTLHPFEIFETFNIPSKRCSDKF